MRVNWPVLAFIVLSVLGLAWAMAQVTREPIIKIHYTLIGA